MILTRRDAMRLVGALPWAATAAAQSKPEPALAPGKPDSLERMALIENFQRQIAGLDSKFEKRSHKSSWEMPYRLFRPSNAQGKVPLIVYLHGSGGLGDDNKKQLELGNIFGTLAWALPENQKRFPCYVLAPQTDRGWAKYEAPQEGKPAHVVPGFGDGNRVALEIVQALTKEFPIDPHRLYISGQSMGGAGVWNMIAHRPKAFAAAIVCCGSRTPDDVTEAAHLPLWAFHGDADRTVPVEASRERIAALRKAGSHPLYTEYAGVDHNVWEWTFTEPALPGWLFAQHA